MEGICVRRDYKTWVLMAVKVVCLVVAFIIGKQVGVHRTGDTSTMCITHPKGDVIIQLDPAELCPRSVAAQATSQSPPSTLGERLPAQHPRSYFRRPVHADDSCPPTVDPSLLHTHIHKNKYRRLEMEGMGLHADGALKDVFGYLHHPSCPVYAEPILASSAMYYPNSSAHRGSPSVNDGVTFLSDFSTCDSVYAMRSGSRDDQPCKCVAVVRVPPGEGHVSEMSITHRTGHIDWPQVLTDQYQDDIVHYYRCVTCTYTSAYTYKLAYRLTYNITYTYAYNDKPPTKPCSNPKPNPNPNPNPNPHQTMQPARGKEPYVALPGPPRQAHCTIHRDHGPPSGP